MLFANLPLLVDGDYKLTESKAIMLYLCMKAKKEEMLGKTNQDKLIIEQILGVIGDCVMGLARPSYQTDDIKEFEKAFEKVIPKLEDLNKFLENKQYVAGDYLTFADFSIDDKLLYINAFAKKVLKVYYLSFCNIILGKHY